MEEYTKRKRFKHKHITPEWPRANGMVERFNRTMKESVQAVNIEGKCLSEAVNELVEVYRATPHSATSVSPFEAMHGGRCMRTTFPLLGSPDKTLDREKDIRYKKKMERRGGREHDLQVGDKVFMRQRADNKLATRFAPNEMTVVEVKGSSITAANEKKLVFRDTSEF